MASRRTHTRLVRAARFASVLALLSMGADHLYVYTVEHYSAVPTIGTLFLLNVIGGFGLGAALLVPLGRLAPPRRADQLTTVLALSTVAVAAGALAGLFVSETTSLFGLMEMGYRTSIVLAIVSEVGAIVAPLALVALTVRTRRFPMARLGLEPRTDGL